MREKEKTMRGLILGTMLITALAMGCDTAKMFQLDEKMDILNANHIALTKIMTDKMGELMKSHYELAALLKPAEADPSAPAGEGATSNLLEELMNQQKREQEALKNRQEQLSKFCRQQEELEKERRELQELFRKMAASFGQNGRPGNAPLSIPYDK